MGRHGRTQARPVRERTRRARTAQQERQPSKRRPCSASRTWNSGSPRPSKRRPGGAHPRRDHADHLPPAATAPPRRLPGFACRRDAERHPRRRLPDAAGGRPAITRITVADRSRTGAGARSRTPVSMSDPGRRAAPQTAPHTVSTFLPVSFTRGTCWRLDAPTGGQSQSIPTRS